MLYAAQPSCLGYGAALMATQAVANAVVAVAGVVVARGAPSSCSTGPLFACGRVWVDGGFNLVSINAWRSASIAACAARRIQ